MVTPSEAALVAGLRDGRAEALAQVIDREYPITALVAELLIDAGVANLVLERAWTAVIEERNSIRHDQSVRSWILGLLIRELERSRAPDAVDPRGDARPSGAFLPPGDRWEGWWRDERSGWTRLPDDDSLVPAVQSIITQAVRELPRLQRAGVLLRDAAQLSIVDCAVLLELSSEDVIALLDAARSSVRDALDRLDVRGEETQL